MGKNTYSPLFPVLTLVNVLLQSYQKLSRCPLFLNILGKCNGTVSVFQCLVAIKYVNS